MGGGGGEGSVPAAAPAGSSVRGQHHGSQLCPPGPASSCTRSGGTAPTAPPRYLTTTLNPTGFCTTPCPNDPLNPPPPPTPLRLSGSSLFCMSLFLTSPAATAAVPRVQPGFLGLGGALLPAPLGTTPTAGGAGSLGVPEGHSGAWEPPVPSPRPPVEDTAAFSVLISVR